MLVDAAGAAGAAIWLPAALGLLGALAACAVVIGLIAIAGAEPLPRATVAVGLTLLAMIALAWAAWQAPPLWAWLCAGAALGLPVSHLAWRAGHVAGRRAAARAAVRPHARSAAPTVPANVAQPPERTAPANHPSLSNTSPPAAPAGPVSTAPQAPGPRHGAAPAARPRVQLGRYRIEREIGGGAMSTVYAGLDPKIGRPLAIKTMALSREFEGADLAEARRRFFREAETAGRLHHPDIVTIHDAGEDQGLAYIAMELLSGRDLQAHTAAPALLPVPVVLRTVARVAQALAHAHSQGVVHRDVKPANVVVDFAADTVKVTDFGIARIADASRTRTGVVLGTPSFMAPEQLAGLRVDGRADLYSLGVMLFQLLTGRLPHEAESMARLMALIANEPAPDVRSLRPELPESLAQLLAQTLAKKPGQRPADGNALAAALRAAEAQVLRMPELATATMPSASGGPVVPSATAFEATVRLDQGEARHNSDT